jgi:hypothetical protein
MIHLLGISSGHDGSTVNVGTSPPPSLELVVPPSSDATHEPRKGVTARTKLSASILDDLCIFYFSVEDLEGPRRTKMPL